MITLPKWIYPAWRVVIVISVLLVASFNIFIEVSVIPQFERIFQDAIPGQVLPGVTQFVLAYRVALTVFACVLLVLSIVAIRQKRDNWCAAILAVIVLQIGISTVALFMPMVTELTGISSQAGSL